MLAALPAAAQISVDGYPVQFHGFFSQGFAYSNDNNYLTMRTSSGDFAFVDGGFNVSSQLTDKFRVGAQAYVRDVGELGNGHVSLDWASGDYRFNDWLGLRAGKVKTVLGLYNDTQDAEFLHTWALLPQSIYPLDLRETSLAHLGADLYGNVSLKGKGSLSYTGYIGTIPNDTRGGYEYGLNAVGLSFKKFGGRVLGADLKWNSPVPGLLVGASYMNATRDAPCTVIQLGDSCDVKFLQDNRSVFYGQYVFRSLRLEGEYSRETQELQASNIFGPYGPAILNESLDQRAWYTAVVYRVSKYLEFGTYNSRFFPHADRLTLSNSAPIPAAQRHIFDQAVTMRIDLTRFLDLKVEGHFINGNGDPSSFRGFYPQDNPAGLKPNTDLLVLRMGVNF